MAFNEIEIQRIKQTIELEFMAKRRPPANIRKELDFGFRINNQSIEFFEIRPNWLDKSVIEEFRFAKTTYVKTQKIWKLYWIRQDLKWHRYEPLLEAKTLEESLHEIVNDPFACFFG